MHVEAQVTVECPFCEGKYGFFKMADGKQGAAHSMPVCTKFSDEDPLMFLRNARYAKGLVMPDDDEWPLVGGGHE